MKRVEDTKVEINIEKSADPRKKEDSKRQVPEWWRITKSILLATVWVFCSTVAAEFAVGMVLKWVLSPSDLASPVWSGIYSVVSYTIAILLIVLVPANLSRKWHTSREEMGLTETPTWTDIGLAPVAFIVGTILAAGLVALFSIFPWFDAEQIQNVGFNVYMSGGERIIAFIILVVIAPIVEELIFRGWLYGQLRKRTNMVVSILVTSLLFGIMHFQWNVGVNVFALSVVLCGLREITGTIYAGILTHMIKNGVAFYLLYVLGM